MDCIGMACLVVNYVLGTITGLFYYGSYCVGFTYYGSIIKLIYCGVCGGDKLLGFERRGREGTTN